MRTQFGFGSVGLQTGDVSLNAEGDIVVMTTEILRNILFREGEAAGALVRNSLANYDLPSLAGMYLTNLQELLSLLERSIRHCSCTDVM